MPTIRPIGSADYYDVTPPLGCAAGDIWSGLPDFGLLGATTVRGIVITPACDLSNRKVETVTYLPILPIRSYCSTLSFLPEVVRAIDSTAKQAGLTIKSLSPQGRFTPPGQPLIDEVRSAAHALKANAKHTASANRILAGLDIVECIAKPGLAAVPGALLKGAFPPKQIDEMLTKMVTNSYRVDLHFVPPDGQSQEWSAIDEPSLVLFRYSCTVPTEVLEDAQDLSISDWNGAIARIAQYTPAALLVGERPLKRAVLRPRFLADMMTRHVGMNVRLGAPDFTSETVATFIKRVTE